MTKTKTTIDVLKGARARISKPAAWLHSDEEEFAVDARGVGVEPASALAVRWDAIGAILAERPSSNDDRWADDPIAALAAAIGSDSRRPYSRVLAWHTAAGRRHADVIAMFDKAIAQALGQKTSGQRAKALL